MRCYAIALGLEIALTMSKNPRNGCSSSHWIWETSSCCTAPYSSLTFWFVLQWANDQLHLPGMLSPPRQTIACRYKTASFLLYSFTVQDTLEVAPGLTRWSVTAVTASSEVPAGKIRALQSLTQTRDTLSTFPWAAPVSFHRSAHSTPLHPEAKAANLT